MLKLKIMKAQVSDLEQKDDLSQTIRMPRQCCATAYSSIAIMQISWKALLFNFAPKHNQTIFSKSRLTTEESAHRWKSGLIRSLVG